MEIFDIKRRDLPDFEKFMNMNVESTEYVKASPAKDASGKDVRKSKDTLKEYQRRIERNPNFSNPVYDPTYKAVTHDKVTKDAGEEPFDYKVWPELDRGYPVVIANDVDEDGNMKMNEGKALPSLKEFEGKMKEVAEIDDKVQEEKERGDERQKEYFVVGTNEKACTSFESFIKPVNEKSVSKAQQRLMGQAYAYKKGTLRKDDINPKYREQVINLSQDMSMEDLKDFAETKHKGLPKKKKDKK